MPRSLKTEPERIVPTPERLRCLSRLPLDRIAQAEQPFFRVKVSEVDPKGWTNFGRRLDGAAG